MGCHPGCMHANSQSASYTTSPLSHLVSSYRIYSGLLENFVTWKWTTKITKLVPHKLWITCLLYACMQLEQKMLRPCMQLE